MTTNTNYSSSDLVFRLVNGAQPGTIFPISTQKCLLGQSHDESGAENGHCAILRGPTGASIKSFGTEVTVNGHPIESQWLNDGDQIEICSAKFEVVQLGHYTIPTPEVAVEVTDPVHQPQKFNIGQLDESPLSTEFDQTESIFSPLDLPAQIEEPVSHQKSHTTSEQSVGSRAVAQARTLEKAFASFDNTEQDRPTAESSLNSEVNGDIGDHQLRNDAELAAEARLREVFTQHLTDHADEIVYDAEEDKTIEEPVENETVSQLLVRMQEKGQLHGFKAENEEDDAAHVAQRQDLATSVAPTPAVQTSPRSHGHVAKLGEEDEAGFAVQDYMNRLLERMGPTKAPAANAPTATAIEETPTFVSDSKVVETVELLTPNEYKPLKRAPEANKNLDAMRELANQSNRVAIEKSQSRQAKTYALTNLTLMLFGQALGGYLVFHATSTQDYMLWTGAAVLGISLFLGGSGIKALMSTNVVRILTKSRRAGAR